MGKTLGEHIADVAEKMYREARRHPDITRRIQTKARSTDVYEVAQDWGARTWPK